jgi:hypothetical protein
VAAPTEGAVDRELPRVRVEQRGQLGREDGLVFGGHEEKVCVS